MDDKVITKEDIDNLTYNNEENIMYEFTNAILEKNNNKAISMYHSFLEDNTSVDYLLVSIYNSYKTLYQVKVLNKDKSVSDIAKIIGKKEYFVKKTLERSMDYTEYELLDIIKYLSSIDKDYKKGLINPVNALEIFIVNKSVN
jgi:DNA polymerase III delta subunit